MKNQVLFILMVSIAFSGLCQSEKTVYSKAKIFLNETNTIKKLAGLGVETDHGDFKSGRYLTTAFSEKELIKIKDAGFSYEVLISDVERDFQEKNARLDPVRIQEELYADFCNKVKKYKIPRNWKFGSMGGHLTYEEMELHLDSMKIKYPNLITSKAQIHTTLSREGRQIWFVKISDNPNVNEPTEPQGLFSAIHHAREPVGMHQLIFFMWYLLENYNSNPEIKTLVENSELFFVPCLNPDGYIFNQTNSPIGGGMWRKNRRDNNDGTFGVDLNRNYGNNWGFDDFGSSPDPAAETYRGDEAFSEPETKAMKAFCEAHNFKNALNYHTYSNLVIHPWGYENIQTPDSNLFRNLTNEMVRENNYRPGTGMEVLNYNSNGSSDDFMYGVTAQKPKIFAMTPEVGDWFWPTMDEIPALCVENIHQNLTVVRALHPIARFTDSTGLFLKAGLSPNTGPYRIRYKLNRFGGNISPASFTVTLKPIGPNATGLNTLTKTYSNLLPQQTVVDSLLVLPLINSLAEAKQFQWEVKVNNGIFTTIDTIRNYGGEPFSNNALSDNCDDLTKWQGSWVKVTTGQQQGTGYFKPIQGNYEPGMRTFFTRNQSFDLRSPAIKVAELSFWTKFGIEKNFDFANLSASTDSGASWTNICTDKSVLSSPFSQQAGENIIIPIWDGFQKQWRKEYTNLKDFLGKKLWLRVYFHSDDFTEFEGFGIDNLRITTNNFLTGNEEMRFSGEMDLAVFPNPGSEQIQISGLEPGKDYALKIFNSLGQMVFESNISANGNSVNVSALKEGYYRIQIINDKGLSFEKPWVHLR